MTFGELRRWMENTKGLDGFKVELEVTSPDGTFSNALGGPWVLMGPETVILAGDAFPVESPG